MQVAWDLVKGLDGNTVIAVVDGGADYNHSNLVPNFWLNTQEFTGNGIDDFMGDISCTECPIGIFALLYIYLI